MDLNHHTVHYNVATGQQKSTITLDELKDRKIEYIRIIWIDLVNHVKSLTVPLEYFEKLLGTSRPGAAIAQAALGLVFITLAPGFGYVHVAQSLPDRD
jgi:glutamine synthetase